MGFSRSKSFLVTAMFLVLLAGQTAGLRRRRQNAPACEAPAPPHNGVAVCGSLPNFQQYCTVRCNERYDFAVSPADAYTCDYSGNWHGSPFPWPDCSGRMRPGRATQKNDLYYYHSNCEANIEEIKQGFLQLYNTLTSSDCSAVNPAITCNVTDIEVECGVTFRRRRDVSDERIRTRAEDHRIVKRQAEQQANLKISFVIVAVFGDGGDVLQHDQAAIATALDEMYFEIADKVENKTLDLPLGNETLEPLHYTGFLPEFELNCAPGQLAKIETYGASCVNCPVGTYMNGTVCVPCAVGWYQDEEMQTQCKQCPAGTSTLSEGSKNSTDCKDADECALGTDTCHEHATCTNTPGSYTCACDHPYIGDGYTCTLADVDECALGTDTCHDDATCTNTPGSYTCACKPGYRGDGSTCTDINECDKGTDTCHDDATCSNTPGSYTCACNPGYRGDGSTCTDINECDEDSDTCHDDATCTNTPGSHTCACNPGYRGDGNTCADIDECDDETDTCHDDATCTNTPGSYTCACNPGFNGDGNTCTDIDECTAGTDTCHAQATCTNTPGGYTCACDHPYTGDGYSCSASCSALYPSLHPARNFGKFRNHCFWSGSHRTPELNYNFARRECESYGGTLAMIKDAETQNFLKNHLKNTSGRTQRNYWIGLDDLNDERTFLWNDDTPLGEYRRFRSNASHKIRDCVVLWRTARKDHWDIKNCAFTMPYICQLPDGS